MIAQEQVDCKYMLEDAREAYKGGMVELVPDLLKECIKTNGLMGEERKEAYKLVINSYLFNYFLEEADTLMYDFVEEFPDYTGESSDPQEFMSLLEAHRKVQIPETAELPVDSTELDNRKFINLLHKWIKNPRVINEFGNTVGFTAGTILSLPNTIEGYSLGNPAEDQSHFGLLPGVMIGGEVNLILNRRLEASSKLLYTLSRFSYKAAPFDFTTYRYVEAQHQLLVPISILYKLNPDDRSICYYLKGGVVPGYLLYATGRGTRSYDASLEDLVVDKNDISESRNRLNLDILIGGGIRIPLKRAFFFLEANVTSDILRENSDEMRYQNNDITWLLYHVDSDFRVHQLSVSGGLCWDLVRQ